MFLGIIFVNKIYYSCLQNKCLQNSLLNNLYFKGGVSMHKVYLNLEKGGTGRTLSLYHLAWTFGDLFNKKVLIVDLDSQKNVSFLFGIDGNTIVAEGGCSMAHVLFKDINPDKQKRNIKDCIYKTIAPNVDIAISSNELKDASVHIPKIKFNSHLLLSKALEEVENEYDYIFFDTNGTYDDIFSNTVAATDLLIPTLIPDVLNLQRFIESMATLKSYAEEGIAPTIGGVLCTSYENTTHCKEIVDFLKKNNYEVWGTIKRQVAMKDAPMAKLPIYKYAPNNQGSWACIRLAHNILKHFDEDFTIPLDKKYRRKKDY